MKKMNISILLITTVLLLTANAQATETKTYLLASWYSIASLTKEGTYKYSKGVMANGKLFNDNGLTAATRLFSLGTLLLVTNIANGKTVQVEVTDRIGKRFAQTRIDLSQYAFSRIANLEQGIVPVNITIIK